MKILIVDDSDRRARVLADSIVSNTGVAEEDIRIESNGVSARRALSEQDFDVLVLDVLLPNRTGDDPSDGVSAALVTELCESDRLRRPGRIIGITAYEDALRAASGVFGKYAWTLISTRENELEWVVQVVNCVKYVSELRGLTLSAEAETDVLWITALRRPEMEAVRRVQWGWKSERPIDDQTFVSEGLFRSGGSEFRAVSCAVDRMGMVATAALTGKLLKIYRPRICVMTGICAGVRAQTSLGTVLLAESSWDYQSGKHAVRESNQVFEVEPNFISCPRPVVARFSQLAEDSEFLAILTRGWPTPWPSTVRLMKGAVSSGSAVLADRAVTENIRAQHRKLLGVDMEIFGLYTAAEFSDPRPIFFAVKAVCDFADDQKNDGAQDLAAYASAATTATFLERYTSELIGN